MKFILDTADVEAIKYCNEFYPLEGVTTNPSIVARAKKDFWTLLAEIRQVIGEEKMLHVQVRANDAAGMVAEACLLKEKLGGNLYIKIPIGEEGLKATKLLKEMGIKVTMTAIFTPMQALLAARAGADFVAPYVNRIDNLSGNGTQVVADIVKIFLEHQIDTQVLAASFKNAEQVHRCALAGCHTVTVTDETLKTMVFHPLTEDALVRFGCDWKAVYGEALITDMV